ncbi:hypothetical protein AB0395_46370 [Streptosporangium sp. NPDC051023]|uniref:alpha/beta fold hydrolase n=1 Tax=Streptosporangium sp. NPDC051023 TaxID=3155410 RepID=UPI00344C31B4
MAVVAALPGEIDRDSRRPGVAQEWEGQIDLVCRIEIRHPLSRIQAPTPVIGCARDVLVPVHHSREIHAAIPGSSYAELDSGHVARAERPEELIKLIRDVIGPGR